MKIARSTVANVKKCAWCGFTGEYKMLKVTPKKSKPACLKCYSFMVSEKPKQL
jgi:hypothetical protein